MAMESLEVLRAACCLAASDGDVSEEELPLLKKLAVLAGVGDASFAAMLDVALNDQATFRRQTSPILSDPERLVQALCEIAAADGRLADSEREIIIEFGTKRELPRERIDALLSEVERKVNRE